MRGGRVLFSCFLCLLFAAVFSLLSVVRGGEWGRFLCPRAAASLPGLRGGLLILRLACAACRLPAASRGRRFFPDAVQTVGLHVRDAGVCRLSGGCTCALPQMGPRSASCFRPACLASFRFCEGFHACRLFARPVCCLRGFSLLSFAFSCLTFASQKSFHLSLMPRRAPHFLFGKKMGEKNREGAR